MKFTYHALQVVVDHNEDGDVIGDIYIPIIEMPSGQRFAHCEAIPVQEDADKFITLLEKLNAEGENVLVSHEAEWSETDPAYGSKQHQKIGDRHLMDAEELERR